jgi:hypothetical protein
MGFKENRSTECICVCVFILYIKYIALPLTCNVHEDYRADEKIDVDILTD